MMTPDDEKLSNLLAYPFLTPAEKLVWIAIPLCRIEIEDDNYSAMSSADKGRLMAATTLSQTTIVNALMAFDIVHVAFKTDES